MKVLGLIPARGGSKGIPGKNIKLLGGKPLLQYTIESALDSQLLTDVIISTDDEKIAEIGNEQGVGVPFLRPKELSGDKSPSIDTVLHSVAEMKKQGKEYDAICLLQPTTPFRPIGLIDSSINRFIELGADSIISVHRVPDHFNPHWTFEEEKSGYLKIATGEESIISRRQELPAAYHRDGAIYVTKCDVLEREKSLFGEKVAFIENQDAELINIDTPDDWKRAEEYIRTNGS